MPASPSPLNYFIGKGIVKWRADGDATVLATTADIATGSPAATLGSMAGLVTGARYEIVGTGIPIGTTFVHDGDTGIAMKNPSGGAANATATNATAAVTITNAFRDVGDAPQFECSPSVSRIDHFSHRLGTRFKDRSVPNEKSMTIKFQLEEFTPENLALFFMGTVTPPGTDPYSVVTILELGEVTGSVRLVGTNDIGDRVQVDIPFVNLTPTGTAGFISDGWGTLEITGEVLGDPITGIFGTILHGITAEVTA